MFRTKLPSVIENHVLSLEPQSLAICHPNDRTVASGVVVVVGIIVNGGGVCNRSQMRTTKCTCVIFDVSIGRP